MPFFLWNWAEKLGVPVADMAAWRDVDLAAELGAQLPFPVYLSNDASAACAAEVVFGPADTPSDFLYVYMGYFVGGGVVLGGALFSGEGNAGAIGPMPVPTAKGPKPLLDVASLSQLERRHREVGKATGAMWEEAEDWRLDPALIEDWLDEAAGGLAYAITAACAVVDFRHAIIDGWIPRAFCAQLVARVDAALDRYDFTGLARPHLRQGTAGADARALGAASLPLSDRFLVEAALGESQNAGAA
jgi:predicted NBD/HSP70 family sugar kinase